MPHAVVTRKFGREQSFRKATVRSLAQALLRYERITTTLPRAKETRRLAERLITLGKRGDLSARRRALALLPDRGLVGRIFSDIAPRFSSRQGGYTRIIRRGHRPGDGASLAILELTELAAPRLKEKPASAKEKAAALPPKEKQPTAERPAEKTKAPEPTKRQPLRPKAVKTDQKEKKQAGFLQGLRKFFKGNKPKQ